MKKKLLLILVLLALVLFSYHIAQAQSLVPTAGGQSCAYGDATECGNYKLNDMIQLVANVAGFILGLVGSVSLLMFVYGGVLMIMSGSGVTSGDGKNKINKGKQVITAAIVGMIIVFSSYMIIKFVLGTLGIEWKGEIQKLQVNSGQEYKV